jgi:adenylate kinase
MSKKSDKKPNIIISGSPGTGKSRVCQKLMQKLDKNSFKCLDISQFCRQNHCIESHDKQLDSLIINEELLLTKLSPLLINGGIIIDYHSVDLFPKELIDGIIHSFII